MTREELVEVERYLLAYAQHLNPANYVSEIQILARRSR